MNLTFSKAPVFGTFFFLDRALRNDPSFRPTVGDYFGFLYGQVAGIATSYYGFGFLGTLNGIVMNIATIELTEKQKIEIIADKLTFDKLVEMGYAVYVTYVDGIPTSSKYDTGIIMLHPEIMKRLRKKFTLAQIDTDFEKLIEDIKGEVLMELKERGNYSGGSGFWRPASEE